MVLDDLFENFVDLWIIALHQLLGALHRLGFTALFELVNDERLEQFDRHRLGQTALVQSELGADHDDRTARVVHALAQQVLTEPALFALQHIAERLERALTAATNRLSAATAIVQVRRRKATAVEWH